MASHGPIPKRKEELRRRNKPDAPTQKVVVEGKVKVPNANPAWCPAAKRLWAALKESAQSKYWEPSDWEAARMALDMYSLEIVKDKPTAEIVKLAFKLLADMGLTEGDRRRMRIEITRTNKPKPDGVTDMDEYRAARQQG